MTPERFQQIEELYHAAREATAQERAALLAQVDPELRREIESLLTQASIGDFMDRPAIQNAPELPLSPKSARACAWGPTVSKANSARVEWEKSFGPSTRD